DGSRQPGGSAFYGALQAARLGARALIVTRGVAREIDALLEPFREELDVRVLPAAHTTTLLTTWTGAQRRQRVLAWAGPIAEDLAFDTAVLHLAPVARESPRRWRGRARFVGLTPQGLARRWSDATNGEISSTAPARAQAELARRCDALVLSEHERSFCEQLIAGARETGALVAVTAAERPTTILCADGRELRVQVPAVADAADDLGAGDVFAAAFFLALCQRSPVEAAARFANCAAAVRVRAAGAGAIGTRAQIDARVRASADAHG
ncbi:MAG TPA: PfkB family carbohydrate kinase, partial [Solirubrobacteraceae bacterium]|nr:PfkB family carbohydrate kinase [Solirubrobacteraceae bacterium]